ncbi:MAG TPA: prenyltransferase/squalene oxidase repeat-containing protein [Acidobacteriota bacterium]|nr:prenyltransferase/squalene oxidase repeat-containing protein [Acidobacteriota bacterium]
MGISSELKLLEFANRVTDDGGFTEQPGGYYRPDATALGVLALERCGPHDLILDSAKLCLASSQGADGRVFISPDMPDSIWPTPLACLAWVGSPQYRKQMNLAVDFLLKTSSRVFQNRPDMPFSHDLEIPGWPWTSDTFAWIEPTAMAILALSAAGYGGHPRVADGVRLIMDRQLSKGGWNYGNTVVYGQELLPQPDQTAIALLALATRVDIQDVSLSLDYIKQRIVSLRSPRSLGWAVMALTAWKQRPDEAREWIKESLDSHEKFGALDTSVLSILALAYFVENTLELFP